MGLYLYIDFLYNHSPLISMMSKILDGLNDKQLEAVTHFTGPLLVIAGAGSGKTRALTNRIAYLIEEKGVNPWNILAVTFTNKAANEMKDRIVKLLSHQDEINLMEGFGDLISAADLNPIREHEIPTVGTFHSICVRILRKHLHLMDFENSFAIYDTADQKILMKMLMQERAVDPKKINPMAVLSHISNAKNQLVGPDDYRQFANDYFTEKVAELYPAYQSALTRNNALDFDDIIMKTVQVFQNFPKVLDQYQEKFKFISVDEYQDTNHAQYVLIKLLAEKYRNLCVIGDADQSIYSWRGATIKNIMDFEQDYPEAKVILLEQNYRSTQTILDAAHCVISKNQNRKDKKLWTDREDGAVIKHFLADNERHEGHFVAENIKGISREYEVPPYKDFVVLYRTNAQSRVMEEVFLRHGIPYKIVGGIRFYERKEIKDIIAYLRVIQNPNDSVSLLRIINTPTRKIGAKTIEALQSFSSRHGISIWSAILLAKENDELSDAKIAALDDFVKLIKDLQDLNQNSTAADMIKHVVSQSGYKKMIDDGSVEGEARLENINELVSVAYKYDKLEGGVSLNIFLEEVSLIADIDSVDDKDNSVTLMTVHSAKGLEFPHVFVIGLEEGVFPHSRSLLDPRELEEERRLLYVAMTRAMDQLYLLHARNRMLYGESKTNAPSQFLTDINQELIESNIGGGINPRRISLNDISRNPVPVEIERGTEVELDSGDRVEHSTFGQGIVVNVQGGIATIAFEDSGVGVKKLALSIAPLKKI